jgi:hypothetical protein
MRPPIWCVSPGQTVLTNCLSPKNSADVQLGTELWRATQLLSLYKIMSRPGEIDRDHRVPLASKARWGVESEISTEEQVDALQRLNALAGSQPNISPPKRQAGDFAMRLAKHLISANKP